MQPCQPIGEGLTDKMKGLKGYVEKVNSQKHSRKIRIPSSDIPNSCFVVLGLAWPFLPEWEFRQTFWVNMARDATGQCANKAQPGYIYAITVTDWCCGVTWGLEEPNRNCHFGMILVSLYYDWISRWSPGLNTSRGWRWEDEMVTGTVMS